ncbi:hypothetical protein SAMN05421827_116115 [Pedobacter terrae]|uniref:PIN domain-containing protein n=1 Tax=Pedobacter terrae TaxID=405671 RepID=A0A1G7ZMV2_9SPHI|nr:hypothetical protein SAMN05421827_116115 [Pedobacter terrae]
MSSFSFVADTNFLIDVHQGLEKTESFLDGTAIVSVISEIELLGWHLLSYCCYFKVSSNTVSYI